MKKFAFSLQRMLAYKESLYEKERNELARLRRERVEVEQRRDATQAQEYAADREYRRKAAAEGVTADEVAAVNYQRRAARYLVEQLEMQMRDLDVRIERQLEVVVQLDRDVKSLEKLKEKKWEEYQFEANKEEQERIAELVSMKFIEDSRENGAAI